jgi:hypothetical protein
MRRGPYEATNVGVEFKGVRSGVERRRGASGLKARDPGRRESPGEKVLKKRRPQRERGRMGTSVRWDAPDLNVQTISFDCPGNTLPSTSAR